MNMAKASMAGQVFVSDFYLRDGAAASEPSYFDNYVIALDNQMRRQTRRGLGRSTNCGCTGIDECANGSHTCPANSDCSDRTPGFECSCSEGYESDLSTATLTCVNIDECKSNKHPHECDVNAVCTDTDGSYTCQCNPGYHDNNTDGRNCFDINECDTNPNACHANAACSNLDGTHSCVCDAGYKGDGLNCEDKDECSLNEHNCHAEATCTNNDGSFVCKCKTGYISVGFGAPGTNCRDADECFNEGDGNTCHTNALCRNNDGSYECQCNTGWVGDGHNTCYDENECTLNKDNL